MLLVDVPLCTYFINVGSAMFSSVISIIAACLLQQPYCYINVIINIELHYYAMSVQRVARGATIIICQYLEQQASRRNKRLFPNLVLATQDTIVVPNITATSASYCFLQNLAILPRFSYKRAKASKLARSLMQARNIANQLVSSSCRSAS